MQPNSLQGDLFAGLSQRQFDVRLQKIRRGRMVLSECKQPSSISNLDPFSVPHDTTQFIPIDGPYGAVNLLSSWP